ncbi:hypothetical protein GCM10009740_23200 [Terrabacter terrae]|uniref:STAS domain-containing protein n=1 Tax=Terrabacter terrae TaxID=318434 RepID=A0ABN2UA99_9MICO
MQLTRTDSGVGAVLRMSGSVHSFDAPRLSEALAKALTENPPCVVCEMSEVTWLDPVCVAVWVGAQWSGPWPGPVVWLVGAHDQPAEALRATGAALFVGLADSAEAAFAQMPTEPPMRRERLILAPVPIAPRRARRFITEVLDSWALSDLAGDATLIVSELVTNGVEHAGSDLELRLGYGHELLHIAVRDRGSVSTRSPSGDGAGHAVESNAGIPERGRGLEIVRKLALASGRSRGPTGGSVYWATLATGERATQQSPARRR